MGYLIRWGYYPTQVIIIHRVNDIRPLAFIKIQNETGDKTIGICLKTKNQNDWGRFLRLTIYQRHGAMGAAILKSMSPNDRRTI